MKRINFVAFVVIFLQCIFLYPFSQVYFTPRDDIKAHLIELIKHEKKSIDGAMYMLTDKNIAQALIDAYVRGVQVTLVLDQISMDRFGKGTFLQNNGVRIIEYKTTSFNPFSTPIMHHKFLIFGVNGSNNKQLLWTGSFNCTVSASKLNYENVLICDEQDVIKQYKQCFCDLVSRISNKNVETA